MKLKNLLLGFCISIGLLPSITSPMLSPKKTTIYKALKIAWYSTELVAAIFSYGALQYCGWDQTTDEEAAIPTLLQIKNNISNLDPIGTIACSLFQVPFLASMGHAMYGLKHEISTINNKQKEAL